MFDSTILDDFGNSNLFLRYSDFLLERSGHNVIQSVFRLSFQINKFQWFEIGLPWPPPPGASLHSSATPETFQLDVGSGEGKLGGLQAIICMGTGRQRLNRLPSGRVVTLYQRAAMFMFDARILKENWMIFGGGISLATTEIGEWICLLRFDRHEADSDKVGACLEGCDASRKVKPSAS